MKNFRAKFSTDVNGSDYQKFEDTERRNEAFSNENSKRMSAYYGRDSRFVFLIVGAIVATLVIGVGLSVGLFYNARNYRFPAIDGGTLFNQTQLPQKQQFENNVMLKMQKSDIGKLTRFVQQLNQKVQQQNQTILRYEKRLKLLNRTTNQQNVTLPELGWYSPWNGYQYRLTRHPGTWQHVRLECQNYGADLAAFGMRNFNTRRFIKNALQNTRLWIGLSDLEQEGVWTWVDGRAANRSDTFWVPGQPTNYGGNEHCGEVGWRNDYQSNDAACTSSRFGICEKRL